MKKPDYAVFVKECERYRTLFGLRDWVVFYYNPDGGVDSDWAARIKVDYQERCATIEFNKCSAVDHQPKKSALHEMMHLAVGAMRGLAYERFTTPDQIENEWEATARRLTEGILAL